MDGVKIGIGIITAGVRTIDLERFRNTTDDKYEIFVFKDEARKGPAFARNQVIKHFKNFDFIFLFDDDCYPNRAGWAEYLIGQSITHDVHFMAYPVLFGDRIVEMRDEMIWWSGACGAFTFLTQKAIKTIGGFNEAYAHYGFEDVTYKKRAKAARLTSRIDAIPFPLQGLQYIHSMDVCHDNPTPNLTHDQKLIHIKANEAAYIAEMESDQIFYPYE